MGDKKSRHNVLHEETEVNTWVFSDDEEHKHIEIKMEDGKDIIIVNGKEVSRETMEEMEEEDQLHGKHIRIKTKSSSGGHSNVVIIKDSDYEDDIEVISKKGNGFFFIDTDDDKDQLYIIDGKEGSKEDVKSVSPNKIETINVYKGDKAIEKYGKKAKDGVIEIKTKKEN